MLLEIINNYAAEILGAILTAMAGALGLAIKNLVARYINTEVKRNIARTVVQGVEQLYKDLNGEEKLERALEAAAEIMANEGISVTYLELRLLLEDALGEFNEVFTKRLPVLEGIAVENLNNEQLRDLLQQIGMQPAEGATREEMLAMLDEVDEIKSE